MLTHTTRRSRIVRVAALAAAAMVVATALTAAALAAGGGASSPAVKTRKTSLGTILVDARGRTLYMFTKDKGPKSSCSGECASDWPPATVAGKAVAGAGVKASLLRAVKRSDGHMQLVYKSHPLYRFSLDAKAGQTKGEAINEFGGNWFAVSPAGTKVMPASTSTSSSGSGSSGDDGGGYGGGGYGG